MKSLLVIFVLFLVVVGGYFWLFNGFGGEEPVAHTNPIDLKISLNPNRSITPNAVETNSLFTHLAFDEVKTKKLWPFKTELAAVARTLNRLQEDREEEKGTWIWTPIMQMTPEYVEEVVNGAAAEGINVIYLSVDSYLDIFVMPKGQERDRLKREFEEKVEYFIVQAAGRGVEVDAEGGWRNWAEGDNTYKAFAIVNFVKTFNRDHRNKFRGFQYDVEPYLLGTFEDNPAAVLTRFVDLIDRTENFLGGSDLRFSVVVPDFYDEKDGFTPSFYYAGERDYTFGHLLKILERRENSALIVMSYRNFAAGADGSIEVSQNEMRTARQGLYRTKIIIAQETGDFPPPYITFHNTSKKYLFGEINKIKDAFSSSPAFGGIAIHYINSFLEME